MNLRATLTFPGLETLLLPFLRYVRGVKKDAGGITQLKTNWGLDTISGRFPPASAVVTTRTSDLTLLPGNEGFVSPLHRDFRVEAVSDDGDIYPIFNGRVRSLTPSSPSNNSRDIELVWELTDLMGLLALRNIPDEQLNDQGEIIQRSFQEPRQAEDVADRFVALLSCLGLDAGRTGGQVDLRGVVDSCCPDPPDDNIKIQAGLRKYMGYLEDTEGGWIYIDHSRQTPPRYNEQITFLGSGSEPKEKNVRFTTSPSQSSNTIPVKAVQATIDTDDLVNQMDFVNMDGTFLGSVGNPDSIEKFGLRPKKITGFFFQPGTAGDAQ